MSISSSTMHAPLTIADLIGRTKVRTIALVIGFAFFTALAAQISFHLPWTPVPITGQTFAVLLAGAALGSKAGAASQFLYVALGAIGLPFYADGTHGWKFVSGATGGYLVGFIVAAALVGALAERRQDRNLLTSIPAMLAGTAIIYLFGVVWLSHVAGFGANEALEKGLTPFVIGDTLKLLAAGFILPATWKFASGSADNQ